MLLVEVRVRVLLAAVEVRAGMGVRAGLEVRVKVGARARVGARAGAWRWCWGGWAQGRGVRPEGGGGLCSAPVPSDIGDAEGEVEQHGVKDVDAVEHLEEMQPSVHLAVRLA